ncbi:lysophospholipase catalytic domain-containing protein [Limtongia smithiae]|uniref:lysophospholipase catalytic domain-containing protein n=1 Tax=Limtongia smithiae TaxID=1125753 RepID=UPI0034CD9653
MRPVREAIEQIAFENFKIAFADDITTGIDKDGTAALERRDFYGGSYEPTNVSCPSSGSLVRNASQGVGSLEADYISSRKTPARKALATWLDRIALDNLDVSSFLTNDTDIPIAFAFSGGGYRAMLTGAGVLAAADSRTVNATGDGQIGGLLQASTYIVGLSGGGWLVGSIMANNFSSVQSLQADASTWDFATSITGFSSSVFSHIDSEVALKETAGYNISIIDYWGLLLSHQLFDYSNGGVGLLWSDIIETPPFAAYDVPYPLLASLLVTPGDDVNIETATAIEVGPFEFGSWDSELYGFVLTEYLGTELSGGTPKSDVCVNGFDSAGLSIGTTSALFNVSPLNSTLIQDYLFPKLITEGVTNLSTSSERNYAIYGPNPFYNIAGVTHSNASYLTLSDGGEDAQNVPLLPLLQPSRAVDVIIACDASADTDYNWPNGESLVATYERQFVHDGSAAMPAVPGEDTFLNLGLATRPTFFGCDSTNTSTTTPLIVWLPNAPYSFFSNLSTLTLSLTTERSADMITNGYNMATRGNGTLDASWPQCLACAVIRREQERRGDEQSEQCKKCFEDYCWDGSVDTSTPDESTEDLSIILTESVLSEAASASSVAATMTSTTANVTTLAVSTSSYAQATTSAVSNNTHSTTATKSSTASASTITGNSTSNSTSMSTTAEPTATATASSGATRMTVLSWSMTAIMVLTALLLI